mmetsp:Transcript_6986/g.17768  ORF Transcript_6986/g.17768 Transcript_6986/m.17768 type:complete len:202 (-) Transcript_6986:846-1451(-)
MAAQAHRPAGLIPCLRCDAAATIRRIHVATVRGGPELRGDGGAGNGVVHCLHFHRRLRLRAHPPRLLLVRDRRRGGRVQQGLHHHLLVPRQPLCLHHHPDGSLLFHRVRGASGDGCAALCRVCRGQQHLLCHARHPRARFPGGGPTSHVQSDPEDPDLYGYLHPRPPLLHGVDPHDLLWRDGLCGPPHGHDWRLVQPPPPH